MKSNVIQFTAKPLYTYDGEDYEDEKLMEPSEIAAKLVIFEALMGAVEDRSEADVLLSLKAKNTLKNDRDRLQEYVKIGFKLWDNNPNTTVLEVFSMDI
jgi:hypothetical protein